MELDECIFEIRDERALKKYRLHRMYCVDFLPRRLGGYLWDTMN